MRRACSLVYAHFLRTSDRVASSICALLSGKVAMGAFTVPPQVVITQHAPPLLPAPVPPVPRRCQLEPASRWRSASATASAAASINDRPTSLQGLDTSDPAEQMLHSGSAIAAQPSRAVRPPPGCRAPLCERLAQHAASADALRAWRAAAAAAIDEVGDAHAAEGGGSTRDELKARAMLIGRCDRRCGLML